MASSPFPKEITLRKPDDMHLHLRQGEVLRRVAKATSETFGRAVVMPNTLPPVVDTKGLTAYKKEILNAGFSHPLMTFKIVPTLPPEEVRSLKKAGAVAGKYYPSGVTTHSSDGPSSWHTVEDLIGAMEEEGVVLSLHGEDPHSFCLDREEKFLPSLVALVKRFPRLRIVLEHLSSSAAVTCLETLPERVGATITTPHLYFTLDDLLGGELRPHLFCKPLVKSPKDRDALRRAAFSGNPRFFFGSDSAPHLREKKEAARGAAGIYSAPTALPALATLFEREGFLSRLEDFISHFGAAFYGLPLATETLCLRKLPWKVPEESCGLIPFLAGQTLPWRACSGV